MSENKRVVLVTGAAGGIGLGIGRAFGSKGWSVVLVDIDSARLDEAQRDLDMAGFDVRVRVCDVRDRGAVAHLASWVAVTYGGVDVVCLNAGGPVPRTSESVTEEDWDRDLSLNLFSVIHGVGVFRPIMEEQGHGHINATASMSGLAPFPPVVTYNVAKAGVIAYMQTVARELSQRGSPVSVSVLCPGEVSTQGIENAMARAVFEGHEPSSDEKEVAEAAQASILSGGMNPDDVGRVLFAGVEAGRFWIFTHPEWIDGPLTTLQDAMKHDGSLPEL